MSNNTFDIEMSDETIDFIAAGLVNYQDSVILHLIKLNLTPLTISEIKVSDIDFHANTINFLGCVIHIDDLTRRVILAALEEDTYFDDQEEEFSLIRSDYLIKPNALETSLDRYNIILNRAKMIEATNGMDILKFNH